MRRVRAVVAAWLLHVGALVALGCVYLDDELPPVPRFGEAPTICVFPGSRVEFSRLSLLHGAARANVERILGAPRSVDAAPDECVRFAYGPRVGLTALFRAGTLRHIWVTEAASVPDSCPARPVRNVPIEARAWYPARVASEGPTGSRIPSS